MTCHACGAPLAATAKFCHKCGAQVGGGQAPGWWVGLPWGVAGAALGALLAGPAPPHGGGRGAGGGSPRGRGGAGGGAPPPPPPPFPKVPPGGRTPRSKPGTCPHS